MRIEQGIMCEAIITRMFSSDDPVMDVDFFNEPTNKFPSLIMFFTTPDRAKQELDRRGINDESLAKELTKDLWFDVATKCYADDEEYAVIYKRYVVIHDIYKMLMTKAINKEPFADDELNAINTLLSPKQNIRVTAEGGQLLINEDPESVILRRLAKGIVDVANGDKDIRICAASDCDIAFVPKRKNHKYHSKSCAHRTYKRLAKVGLKQ